MGHQDGTPRARAREAETDLNVAMKEQQVVLLRLEGLEFDVIADRLGYSHRSAAHKAYRRCLARIPETAARQARQEQELRLNVALAAIWPHVAKGAQWAIESMLSIEERRAKLLGLDASKEEAGQQHNYTRHIVLEHRAAPQIASPHDA